ncbi:AMP-binding protein [Mycolicibacterium sp. S2-37]|uniref:AMP-binding protein n=1 Tax=Mycolicibacterium sp. S2-37 TaxID=2810297 RepID=UPI001A94AC5D|nr:AMP-binding protein [Mycolicibacterium sp. S2-37]MBO0678423.1 AMP-binding protein [Mycolicibacterium sp. S2-37]
MAQQSVLSLLRERAGLQPGDVAYTYTDYDLDPGGRVESLTWSQVYRRAVNVALALAQHGTAGDRAVIAAPQGLDFIAAFLGALQAGFIAVPLSAPFAGVPDERVSAVLGDAAPTVVLTTAAVAPAFADYAPAHGRGPAIVAVDDLALDVRTGPAPRVAHPPATAYLQYTSGSTRLPAGVMISDRNLQANFRQLMAAYFPDLDGVAPPDTTIVSWLPFYHDMGLVLGVIGPILGGYRAQLTSPVAFLQRPARWLQTLAAHPHAFSAAPNFAFELAVRRTSDEDMAGRDLGGVQRIVSGSERVHPATLDRFVERFAPFGARPDMMCPSYGLAEATVYVATRRGGHPPQIAHFDSEALAAGAAVRCPPDTGSPLLSYGTPSSPAVRIVDPHTAAECPPGTVGEIWVRGDNVADGYWNRPEETRLTFGAELAGVDGPWLRTGDLGFDSDGELFIVGRVKDLLIVYGRNHYPEDIEATVAAITGGRVAAISVPTENPETTEKLVTIIEFKRRGGSDAGSDADVLAKLRTVRHQVTSAISRSHGLNVADLVLVPPGSIPTTTSGKIRRAACVEHYRHARFSRLDA